MPPPSVEPPVLSAAWCDHHFDPAAQELASHLYPTLDRMRERCPVVHSGAYDGLWIALGYDHAVRIAQDWRTFSSASGVGLQAPTMVVVPLPVMSDPPLQQAYKRIVNPFFTPAAVHRNEAATRHLVSTLIDGFVEDGEVEFMDAFARPFPGRLFFERFLNAPADEAEMMNQLSLNAVKPRNPDGPECWRRMFAWIQEFVARRRTEAPRGDVVDAILTAEIEGRPITDTEIFGLVQLLILGGLDTTAGALGHFMIRFCTQPEIPALLRSRSDRIDDVVEELLRLDGPFVSIGRVATIETELGGHRIAAGERVVFYWASANHDPAHFERPGEFVLDRDSNRHLAFGLGTHRCVGSNLARMNLRIAVLELAHRLPDVRLAVPVEEIEFHSIHNRTPIHVPVEFTPGPRRGRTTVS